MFGVGLGQIVNVLAKFERKNLQVDPMQCTRLRHKVSTCSRCADHCPEHAITWDPAIKVDQDKCTGCGICTGVCPTGALEASSPTNAEILARLEQRKQTASIAFACPMAFKGSDDRVIQVNCLGRLDESILVGAVSYGIEQVVLVDRPCQDCASAVGRQAAGQAVAESNALASAFVAAPRATFASQLPFTISAAASSASGEAVSRRAFFSMLTRETQAAAKLTVSAVLEKEPEKPVELKKGELPRRMPAKRQLLLEDLKRLGKPADTAFESQNQSWAVCQIKENCAGCSMCAFFCPTGALAKTEQDGKPGLAFLVSKCTDCGLCAEVCYWKALDLNPQVDLAKALQDASDTFIYGPDATAMLTPEHKLKRLLQSMT